MLMPESPTYVRRRPAGPVAGPPGDRPTAGPSPGERGYLPRRGPAPSMLPTLDALWDGLDRVDSHFWQAEELDHIRGNAQP